MLFFLLPQRQLTKHFLLLQLKLKEILFLIRLVLFCFSNYIAIFDFDFCPQFFKANKCKSTGLVPIAHRLVKKLSLFYILLTMTLKLEHLRAWFLLICKELMYLYFDFYFEFQLFFFVFNFTLIPINFKSSNIVKISFIKEHLLSLLF